MKIKMIAMVAVTSLTLVACQTTNQGQKETLGGLGGAVIGGILGSKIGKGNGQLWATGAGVLLGGLVGKEIGRSLDAADKAALNQANVSAQTAPIGEKITWDNPDSGNYGSVTPTREGRTERGEYCREYQQEIVVGGVQEIGYGTACRQPDGSWRIVN